MELRLLASLHNHRRDTAHTVESRRDVVRGHLPELRLRNRIRGEAVAENGKRSKGKAVTLDLGSRRKFGLDLGQGRVNQLQRLKHVDLPVEKQVDFG